MTTDTPNWRQFTRDVCWSPAISHAMRLLALAAPLEGRPTRFRCEGIRRRWYLPHRRER
jgi:hypothetical protein